MHETDGIPLPGLAEYSVSALAADLRHAVEGRYPLVRVRGEVSGVKAASSGHVYFSLKDEHAVLDAVCWRGAAQKTRDAIAEGAEVVCTGKITTFGARSKYQMIAESAEIAGAGALMALLEKRKQALAQEGLFDACRKRPLPYLPDVIAVVTSPTGAVIRDILHRLKDRFPRHVLLWPVAVQGERAADEIVAAFARIADVVRTRPEGIPVPDLVILARGGGSIEDLWPFNEERVVRAVASCPVPVITAVGHETDTTLVDYAADKRAPTPTGAAEMATPVRAELMMQADLAEERLRSALRSLLRYRKAALAAARRHMIQLGTQIGARPERRLIQASERLAAAPLSFLARKESRFLILTARLRPALIGTERSAERTERQRERLRCAVESYLRQKAARLEMLERVAKSCSHQAVLERGYAVVRQEGHIVTDKARLKPDAPLSVEFRDGTATVGPGGGVSPKRLAKRPDPAPQGTLF